MVKKDPLQGSIWTPPYGVQRVQNDPKRAQKKTWPKDAENWFPWIVITLDTKNPRLRATFCDLKWHFWHDPDQWRQRVIWRIRKWPKRVDLGIPPYFWSKKGHFLKNARPVENKGDLAYEKNTKKVKNGANFTTTASLGVIFTTIPSRRGHFHYHSQPRGLKSGGKRGLRGLNPAYFDLRKMTLFWPKRAKRVKNGAFGYKSGLFDSYRWVDPWAKSG